MRPPSTDAEDQMDSPTPAVVALRGPLQAGLREAGPGCVSGGACGCRLKGSVGFAMGAVGGRSLPPGADRSLSPHHTFGCYMMRSAVGLPFLVSSFFLFSPLPSLQGPDKVSAKSS